MKILITLLFSCLCASAQVVTNITALLQSVPKNKQACMPAYFYVAEGAYKPTAVQPTNTWYYQTTNVITVTCTNSDAMISMTSSFLAHQCAKGTLVYTNPSYPQDTFRFTLFWSNNIVPPTNQFVTLDVTGLRTNSP